MFRLPTFTTVVNPSKYSFSFGSGLGSIESVLRFRLKSSDVKNFIGDPVSIIVEKCWLVTFSSNPNAWAAVPFTCKTMAFSCHSELYSKLYAGWSIEDIYQGICVFFDVAMIGRCTVTSGSRRCWSFWKFRSKIRNVRHQTSTFKRADPAGTKTEEEAKKKTDRSQTQPERQTSLSLTPEKTQKRLKRTKPRVVSYPQRMSWKAQRRSRTLARRLWRLHQDQHVLSFSVHL